MPPRSFRLALESVSFKKPESSMKYAIAGIGFTAFNLARIRHQVRWNWITILNGLTLTPGKYCELCLLVCSLLTPALVDKRPFQTYRSESTKILGMDVTIFISFVRRRLVLFTAKGKTLDGFFPFDSDSDGEIRLGPPMRCQASDNEPEEVVMPLQFLAKS
ncbi:hypothetical protein BDN71DRAFT_1509115 [Pleurotus eryngii]|uniref:Uncharacterized protein n=1 Tax=Pleurotus eryngii TaxID=5323 RepID=A0A9P6DE45_PLEER|nr:hypothetical protein BDN71DRAFT_1509115 [Pleurotus eryngii]